MRILCVFAFILLAFSFAGCGGNDDDDNNNDNNTSGEIYGGFLSMSPGSWSEYVDDEGNRTKYEYIGIDTYNGSECFVMEFSMNIDGEEMVSQIWIDKASGASKLYVIKQGGMVMKLSIDQTPDIPGGESEDNTTMTEIGAKDYTTPTGKKVSATAYKEGNDEYWISGEVPFGQVKYVENGKTIMQLYDFGTSGAVRDISREEAMNAMSLTFP